MKRAIIPAAGAGVLLLGAWELYRYVFMRDPGWLFPPLLDKKGHEPDYYLQRDSSAEKLRRRPCLRYSIYNEDGVPLSGFYYCCGGEPCGRIAFVIHGYRSEHNETAGIVFDYYMSRGFDVFTCDHAAHGESGGAVIGYASYEPRDCLRWIDFLRMRFGSGIKIVLHGFSMGGATVLRMSPEVPENVRFIVDDSGYGSLRELLAPKLGAALNTVALINRAVTGRRLQDTDAGRDMLASRVPILFVHGTEDVTVPYATGKALFERCTAEKDCLFVPGARHIEAMFRAPEEYAAKLDGFIRKYF